MSETLTHQEQQIDAIERYASFLERTSQDWIALKEAGELTHEQPGSRQAYQATGNYLRILALEAGVDEANRGPFATGTQAILRHQFILAVKSRELGLDEAAAARLAHNHASYAALARIAAQPRPLALELERQYALVSGLNPEEPAFRGSFSGDVDRHGDPKVVIPTLKDTIRFLSEHEDMRYRVEDHREDRPGLKDGCHALHAGLLRPMQSALADIVVTDPDLLRATLDGAGE